MSQRSDRSYLRSRSAMMAGIAGVALIANAARRPASSPQASSQTPPPSSTTTTPPSTPPVTAAVDSQKPKPDSVAAPMDSAAMANMAAMPGMDHSRMTATAPQTHGAAAAWPVDPATGQTLINGIPVVGRVFTLQKTDGTVKIANVAAVRHGESMVPLPPVVKRAYTPATSANTRRMRGIMIQATLWDMDHKRSATRDRFYLPVR